MRAIARVMPIGSFAWKIFRPKETPAAPENLKVPATQTLSVVAQASGVQIYECNASKTDPTRFEWVPLV